jgi:hypothetical protein
MKYFALLQFGAIGIFKLFATFFLCLLVGDKVSELKTQGA